MPKVGKTLSEWRSAIKALAASVRSTFGRGEAPSKANKEAYQEYVRFQACSKVIGQRDLFTGVTRTCTCSYHAASTGRGDAADANDNPDPAQSRSQSVVQRDGGSLTDDEAAPNDRLQNTHPDVRGHPFLRAAMELGDDEPGLPGCGQRGVLNRKSLSTLKVFIAPGYRGYILGVPVACVRGKCGSKVWSTNSSEFLSAQDAAVKDLYPSRLPRDATSHVIDDKILARVGRYAVGGDANFTRLAEALAEEDWVEYMKAGRKYRRWVSTWRQSAVGAPQGIEAPAWLSFDEYFHNAFLGPAQLRE
ncbi:hypothetical protein FOZ63_006039, partial [Perkinsus olseni]